jgi:ABC-type transport system involved in multi-copper enzyme maturation permease subunit
MMRANLRRYAMWQLRDFIRDRGIALLLVGFLIGFTVVGPFKAMGGTLDQRMADRLLAAVLVQVPFICAFIALNGIISNDRKLGYYRFLFSKPVGIPAYYAQLFVIYLVGFLAVSGVLLGLFSIFAHPVSPVGPLLYSALVFLSFGGIAFLVSSLFRHDWPILAAIFLGSSILHSMWRYDEGIKRLVLSVLPPVYKLPDMIPQIVQDRTADVNSLLWLLGYSAVCFAAGLLVLKRRPFA